jgi:hypothetical protein
MSRFAISVVVILVILIGGLVFLSGRNAEQEQIHVEKAVSLANLS